MWTAAIWGHYITYTSVFCRCEVSMALNIPGVIAVVVFYILILGTGIWAARKSRNTERKRCGDQAEVVLLGNRSISLLVGIFTMTGMLACGTNNYFIL